MITDLRTEPWLTEEANRILDLIIQNGTMAYRRSQPNIGFNYPKRHQFTCF